MTLERKVNIGLLLNSDALTESILKSLEYRYDFNHANINQNLDDYASILTDNRQLVESGFFFNNLKTPAIYLYSGEKMGSINHLIDRNIFRVVFIPDINNLNQVFESPLRDELPVQNSLDNVISFSKKVYCFINNHNWFLTEAGQRINSEKRIRDEIHFTYEGDYGVYDHLKARMKAIRGGKRLISKTEATYQAIKVYYLHKEAERATSAIKGLRRLLPKNQAEETLAKAPEDLDEILRAASQEEKQIIDGIRRHPDALMPAAFSLIDQASSFSLIDQESNPVEASAWSKSVIQDFLQIAERFIRRALQRGQFVMPHQTLRHYETATHHDVYIDSLIMPEKELEERLKRAIHIKELKYEHGAKVEFAAYKELTFRENARKECKKILAQLETVPEDLDQQIDNTKYTYRDILFYSNLVQRNLPELYPPVALGLHLERYLIMDYIGGNLQKDKIEENDTFTFFNALPIIELFGKEFARDFKRIMLFKKNESLAELLCLDTPLPAEVEPEILDYEKKFNEAVLACLRFFDKLSEEDKHYIDVASSALQSGLHNQQRVQTAGDFSVKNDLFNAQKGRRFKDLANYIANIKKSNYNNKNISSLRSFIRTNHYEIDFEKAHRQSHIFDTRQHNKFGYWNLAPEDEKNGLYHFLLCVGKANALRMFKEKKGDFDLVGDIIKKINDFEKDNSKLSYGEIFDYLSTKKIIPYSSHEQCLEDWFLMGAYRSFKDLAFEFEEGYFQRNKENKSYQNGIKNYLEKISDSLDSLASIMEKRTGQKLEINAITLDQKSEMLKKMMDNPSDNPELNQLVKIKYLDYLCSHLNRRLQGFP